MNFRHSGHRDNAWFVIALLVAAVFFSARFVQDEREADRIARAASQPQAVAYDSRTPANARIAYAENRGR